MWRLTQTSGVHIKIIKGLLLIDFFLREREERREEHRFVVPLIYSLLDSSMGPDWGSNHSLGRIRPHSNQLSYLARAHVRIILN